MENKKHSGAVPEPSCRESKAHHNNPQTFPHLPWWCHGGAKEQCECPRFPLTPTDIADLGSDGSWESHLPAVSPEHSVPTSLSTMDQVGEEETREQETAARQSGDSSPATSEKADSVRAPRQQLSSGRWWWDLQQRHLMTNEDVSVGLVVSGRDESLTETHLRKLNPLTRLFQFRKNSIPQEAC